ncbi:hypothetical protein N9219_00220 [bacterium]|nr:hypothetical protein [bacterium]
MKVQRFNPESDFAPIPFEERICLKALEMKKNNLVWRPHVGCFQPSKNFFTSMD